MNLQARELGYSVRTPSSTFIVTLWNVPFEDVSKAQVIHGYFDTKDQAEKFARPFVNAPEMASVHPVEEYDKTLAQVYDHMQTRIERAKEDLGFARTQEESAYHQGVLNKAQSAVSQIREELSTFNPALWAELQTKPIQESDDFRI